jgi:hypothetical protein
VGFKLLTVMVLIEFLQPVELLACPLTLRRVLETAVGLYFGLTYIERTEMAIETYQHELTE